jgi:hypothetical protein
MGGRRIYRIVPSFLADKVFQIVVEPLIRQDYFRAASTFVAECWLVWQFSTNSIVPGSEYCNGSEPSECGEIDPLACKPQIQLNLTSNFVNEPDDGIALRVGTGRTQRNLFHFRYQYRRHRSNQLHQKPFGTLSWIEVCLYLSSHESCGDSSQFPSPKEGSNVDMERSIPEKDS